MRGALGIERLAWLFQLKGCERGCIVGRCSSGYLWWCAACKIYACLSNVENSLVIDSILVDTGSHKLAVDIGSIVAECYGFAVLDIGFCQYLGILVENRRLCQNLYLDNVLQLGVGRNGDASALMLFHSWVGSISPRIFFALSLVACWSLCVVFCELFCGVRGTISCLAQLAINKELARIKNSLFVISF